MRMYQEVADDPAAEFHFFHGREAAELFAYGVTAVMMTSEKPTEE